MPLQRPCLKLFSCPLVRATRYYLPTCQGNKLFSCPLVRATRYFLPTCQGNKLFSYPLVRATSNYNMPTCEGCLVSCIFFLFFYFIFYFFNVFSILYILYSFIHLSKQYFSFYISLIFI